MHAREWSLENYVFRFPFSLSCVFPKFTAKNNKSLKMAQKVDTTQLQCSRLFSVEGWVCLVTGGGTGIGLMCAQALAANGSYPPK